VTGPERMDSPRAESPAAAGSPGSSHGDAHERVVHARSSLFGAVIGSDGRWKEAKASIFSNVLYTVTLYNECTSALTLEVVPRSRRSTCRMALAGAAPNP